MTKPTERTAKLPAAGPLSAADMAVPAGAFMQAAGLTIDEASGTVVRGHLVIGKEHHQPRGVVHGGVYTTAVETAASVGASLAVYSQGQYAVGVNNNTDFLRTKREGTLDVVAEAVFQGRTQQLWQVVITSRGSGKLVARGQVRLHNMDLPRNPDQLPADADG